MSNASRPTTQPAMIRHAPTPTAISTTAPTRAAIKLVSPIEPSMNPTAASHQPTDVLAISPAMSVPGSCVDIVFNVVAEL